MREKLLFAAPALAMCCGAAISTNTSATNMSDITSESDFVTCMTQSIEAVCSLGQNLSLSAPILMQNGGNITLNLGDFSITAASGFTNPGMGMITVAHGSTLTVNGGSGQITAGDTEAYAAVRMTDASDAGDTYPAKLVVNGGSLVGFSAGISGNGNVGRGNTAIVINGGSVKGINITESSSKDIGVGIYHPQSGIIELNGGEVSGVGAGIAIKAGTLIMADGIVKCTGPDSTPTSLYSNGAKASGAAIQIESNTRYTGNIKLEISGGQVISEQGVSIYEYGATDQPTAVQQFAISGGIFKSADGKQSIMTSEALSEAFPEAISGGTFSTEPTNIPEGYHVVKNDDGTWSVIKNVEPTPEPEPTPVAPGAPDTGISEQAGINPFVALAVGATTLAAAILSFKRARSGSKVKF